MKKYRLTDADGEEFVVEELPAEETPVENPTQDDGEEAYLTAEEITWLKAFIAAQKQTTDSCKDEDEDTRVEDEDEDDKDEDEDKSVSDSIFGTVKKIADTKPVAKVSEEDVNAAWQAKYDKIRGGNN